MSRNELIAALREARGPDVALDRWIWWETLSHEAKQSIAGPYAREHIDKAKHPGEACGQFYDSSNPGCIAKLSERRQFTASLDAALTLVPPGFAWEVKAANVEGSMEYRGQVNYEKPAYATTPALTLCIAALLARDSDDVR